MQKLRIWFVTFSKQVRKCNVNTLELTNGGFFKVEIYVFYMNLAVQDISLCKKAKQS